MKYLVMLCDGMADEPNAQLDNSTPMAKAVKPCMDYLASKGEVGMVKTVAEGLKPGSDVANLSVLGYEPAVYYSGRSPLEAASIGIDLKDTDVTLRCNLVTLSDEENYEDKSMVQATFQQKRQESLSIMLRKSSATIFLSSIRVLHTVIVLYGKTAILIRANSHLLTIFQVV